MSPAAPVVPVLALTGYLGAGKTTVLNHLLAAPGARVGVIVNDFGDVNVDAALVSGQVDEPVSAAGGCLCCLLDDDTLDRALARLAQPRLRLDAIVVEASGIAEPGALAALIGYTDVAGVRPGGVIEVVDAVEYFATVDTDADRGGPAPQRFAAASLVLLNKCDRLPADGRDAQLDRITARVRQANPGVHVVRCVGGQVDPALIFDVASTDGRAEELPFVGTATGADQPHRHVGAATVGTDGPVEAARLVDLLEDPPAGAYRIKGQVAVRTGARVRRYDVNLVGRSIHVASAAPGAGTDGYLVAIGDELDAADARRQLTRALAATAVTSAAGYRRLQRHRRLSR